MFIGYRSLAAAFWPNCCRYRMSCSEYMEKAILAKGLFDGVISGLKRVLSCHPWTSAKALSKWDLDPLLGPQRD